MPHMGGDLRHFDAFLVAFFVDEAELDFVCYLGKQGKVGAGSIKGGSQWGGFAGPDLAAVALGGRGDCVHGGSVHAHEHNHFLVSSAVRKPSVNNANAAMEVVAIIRARSLAGGFCKLALGLFHQGGTEYEVNGR